MSLGEDEKKEKEKRSMPGTDMGASHGLRKDQKLVRFPESPNLPSLALAPSMRGPAWPLQAAPSHSQSSEASGSSVTELAALEVL